MLVVLLAVGVSFNGNAVQKRTKTKAKSKTSRPALVVKKGEVKTFGDYLSVQQYSIKKGESQITIDYPISGNEPLLNEARKFVVGSVVDMNDEQAIARYLNNPEGLLKDIIKGYDYRCPPMEACETMEQAVNVNYENGKIITFLSSKSFYAGGSHGGAQEYGATFLISTGQQLTYKDMPSFSVLKKEILSDLSKEFQLPQSEFDDYGVNVTGYPDADPYIDASGVVFQYQLYEIGPYAMGMPKVTFPISFMKSKCPASAQKFF